MGNCLVRWWTGGEPTSEYFSTRIEKMMRSRSEYPSPVEHEIEHSRGHWTKVRGLPDSSEDDNFEEVDRENKEVFRELMNDPQWKQHEFGDFFMEWSPQWNLSSQKIAEGGQAQIFEVTVVDGNVESKFLLKVFNRGSRLSDLRKQWPCGILRREVLSVATFGFLTDDGRFGFGMLKCWGDLRKLIDKAMIEKNNQSPPFPYEWSGVIWHAKHVMFRIAFHMEMLHKKGIIHRDLKSENILFYANDKVLDPNTITLTEMLSDRSIFVADFECSMEVLGTGYWRAPEILLASLDGSAVDFSEKGDVYAFGMTCFEIVTGRVPFEGELEPWRRADKVLVIEGRRPKFPSDVDVALKNLIERCWNPIPNERPSFSEILEVLKP